jgi:hypothetical protein
MSTASARKAAAPAKKAAAPAKKAAAPAKKVAAVVGKPEPGFMLQNGLHVPLGSPSGKVVPPSKFASGLEASQKQIRHSLSELASVFTQDFEVSEIELSVSFSADGKFLGFGVGGAMSVKVKIKPSSDAA